MANIPGILGPLGGRICWERAALNPCHINPFSYGVPLFYFFGDHGPSLFLWKLLIGWVYQEQSGCPLTTLPLWKVFYQKKSGGSIPWFHLPRNRQFLCWELETDNFSSIEGLVKTPKLRKNSSMHDLPISVKGLLFFGVFSYHQTHNLLVNGH